MAATSLIRVVIELREKIFAGKYPPGMRLAEIPIAESLGVSRTPVRLALSQLAQEGLVIQLPTGGFSVRAYKVEEIANAIKVRGVLEGLAARLVAEQGVTRKSARELNECLAQGDAALASNDLSYKQFQAYIEMNRRFHQLIVSAAENHALSRALELNDKLPFAAAHALIAGQAFLPNAHRMLLFTHNQHHQLVAALTEGEAVLAQSIAEQHAYNAIYNLNALLQASQTENIDVPGISLIDVPKLETA